MIWSGQCHFGAPECVRWLCGTDLESPSTIRDGTRSASKGAHTEHCRSGMRPLPAKPCLPEPGRTTYWSVPCRFAAGKSVRRLCRTICTIGAIPPAYPVCPHARRAVWAVFRPLSEPWRVPQQQARAWADPKRSSRPALGRGTCLYRRYSDFIQRYAQK